MTSQRLNHLLRRMAGRRILVVGDVMLDHYISGAVRRISPEAPVPVVEFQTESHLPGGAANVARNLASLGAKVELFGVVGRDGDATILKDTLRAAGIAASGLLALGDRPTTVKTRVLASHQQMLRVDRESRQPLAAAARGKLLQGIKRASRGADAIIVADYAKGVIDQDGMDALLALARDSGVPVHIDPKPIRALGMKGCALLAPNRKETFELAGMADQPLGENPAEHAGLRKAMARIQELHAPEMLLVTLGEGGMLLRDGAGALRHLPTAARDIYDVSGAGDTVIATFVLARAAGAEALEAATLANLAAGIVVGKLGTATVIPLELIERLK